MSKSIYKGFIKNINGDYILPITRAELVLDASGMPAFNSSAFVAEASTNGEGGRYGLVSPATLELINSLTTGTDGGSLGDIYANISILNTKLNHINSSLSVGDSILNFYTEQDNVISQTPIKFAGDGNVTVNAANNTINLGLSTINTDTLTVENDKILSGISVDRYGRVTNIISSNTLSGLSLVNCTVPSENIGNSDTSLVNKKYVADAINQISASALGALKFAGNVAEASIAQNYCKEINLNNYYKVSAKFSLSADYIHDASTIVNLDLGDTLIVSKNTSGDIKFTYIPSGDEEVTVLSVANGLNIEDSTYKYIIQNQTGEISLNFNSPFSVTNTGNFVSISLPQVSLSSDGYLSASDYSSFIASANKTIAYTPILKPTIEDGVIKTPGIYEIGTVTIGDVTETVYGKNNISTLELIGGNEPQLKFTETGSPDVTIKITGGNGIATSIVGNALNITSTNVVSNQDNHDKSKSTQYLNIEDNHKFSVVLGSRNGATINDGITDYREFATFQDAVIASALTFEAISYSLKDTTSPGENDPFRYGNQSLRDIINITI